MSPSCRPGSDLLVCHDCGRRTFAYKVGDLLVEGDLVVEGLRYLECGSCGSLFFDDAAMGEIESQRTAKLR